MKVEIQSRKWITPSSPTPPHLANLKLSFLDQFHPPLYASTIFYYQASSFVNDIDVEQCSRKLQKSLSQTLTLFYPLAGRLNQDNLSIDCNDSGVDYLEAHVNGSLSQLLRGKELLPSLVPHSLQPQGSPLIMVQFNQFEDGGVAIGVCGNLVVADGFTIFTFVNAWATACRIRIEKLVHCPSFQLSSLFRPRDHMAKVEPDHPVPESVDEGKKIVIRNFEFDGATISKLRKMVAAVECGGLKFSNHRPTRSEVVTALIWRALIRVAQARKDSSRPSLLTLPVNMRGRTSLMLIPKYSCGNFIARAICRYMPNDESKEAHLHDLVRLVHEAATRVITDCAKASSGDDLFVNMADTSKEVDLELSKGNADFYEFTSWVNFPAYETDFGFGKPDWVTPTNIQMENIGCLVDTKDGEGIEAWLILEEKDMFLFQQNLDIISMSKL